MERVKYITLMRLQLKAPKIELKHDWFRTFKKFKSGKYIEVLLKIFNILINEH